MDFDLLIQDLDLDQSICIDMISLYAKWFKMLNNFA